MSGANTPKSKKRIRQALIDMMKAHQTGKTRLTPGLELSVIRLIGVIDGYFPPESAVFIRPKGVKHLGRYAETEEEPDEDEVVRKLREEANKLRGDTSLPSA